MPLERFTDRVVVVTGAASGIGRATAARLAAEGAKVLASDVTADALDEAVLAARAGRSRWPCRSTPRAPSPGPSRDETTRPWS